MKEKTKIQLHTLIYAVFFSVILLMIGCADTSVKNGNISNSSDNEAIVYKTGNPECDKAMADLDEAIFKVSGGPDAELRNKAQQAEIEKRSYLKALEDPNNKPEEKKQITDICKTTLERRIKELTPSK